MPRSGTHPLPRHRRRITKTQVIATCLPLVALVAAFALGTDSTNQPSAESEPSAPSMTPAVASAASKQKIDHPGRGHGPKHSNTATPTESPTDTSDTTDETGTPDTNTPAEPPTTPTEPPTDAPDADVAFGPTSGRPFADNSPFNVPIGTDAAIDPNSRAMVDVLAGRGYATAQVYADTPPIYHATASTPRYAINCTESWGTCDLERMRVPIPSGAVAANGHDRNMVVIDWSTRLAYEFWKYDDNQTTTAWGAVCSIDGSGTGRADSDPCRYGAVGAGVSRLAGVIRTYEIRQGEINHALVGPTGFSCKDGYRYPAVKTDGWSTRSDCIPEGAHVQLDPSVDCEAIPGIPDWEVAVCRALQKYGWYNIDNGNVGVEGFGIQFENPAGESDPYAPIGLKDYTQIGHIPLDRLRVLVK